MLESQPESLEHFILYAGYAKALVKTLRFHIQNLSSKGMLDEAELALVDALLIGFCKTDTDFEEVIKHCMARTDKGEHLILALNQVFKEQGFRE